MIFNDALKSY